jgi:OmpA-OmpF porin, OOP family
MRINNCGLMFLLLACACCTATRAADIKGGKDDPYAGRYEGSEIRVYKSFEFDEFPFISGPFSATDGRIGSMQTVQGKLTLIGYRIPAGTSFVQVARNFRLRLEQQGFKVGFECDTAKGDCGSALDFAEQIRKPTPLPEPGQYEWDRFNYRFLSATLERPEGNLYTTVWVTKNSNNPEPVFVYVSVLEQQPMAYKMIDAAKMASEIVQAGHIALYGIHFDTDRADIKPESKPTLKEIAELLHQHPDLKLVIVGHTDNQGTLDYNMDLSNRRARAVRDALVKQYGIATARLSAWGAGYLAPVASNKNEEGRAKNRRVELVEQ